MNEINDQDRLMSALAYPIGLVAIIILLVEDMKNRPFQKYHAVQALAVNIVVIVLATLLSPTCIGPFLLWIPLLYWAYKAYQGEYFEIPALTNFLRQQGWLQ